MSINVKTRRRAQAPIENRILRMRDLRERFGGISASHIYAMVASGRFPKPFPIIPGGRATGWFESTIDAYLTNGASTAALEEQEQKPEPVAFWHRDKGFYWAKPTEFDVPTVTVVPPLPLYTAPPKPDAIARAVEAEREAILEHCEAVCKAQAGYGPPPSLMQLMDFIRARGSK